MILRLETNEFTTGKFCNFGNMRIEVYEKYAVRSTYDQSWWELNMPPGTTPPESTYGYRRTMVGIDYIERPIEIPGSKDEMMIRFWSGEDMIIKADYDDFCILLADLEDGLLDYDDEVPPQIRAENQQ